MFSLAIFGLIMLVISSSSNVSMSKHVRNVNCNKAVSCNCF